MLMSDTDVLPSLATAGGATPRVAHLRRGGTSVVVDLEATPHPVIVHWGEDLGAISSHALRSLADAAAPQRVSGGLDVTARLGVLPT
ncbi:hypothetical protein, partial [Pseudomonas sp. PS02285]|uniref:hypothetical protein n=1 Tax=Pseudomonas sp. PS02285 TaxID=2991441 RepID=UPI00249C8B91